MADDKLGEEGLAVLFGLQTAGLQTYPVTPSRIFRFLPRSLREKWHEDYLVREVLPRLRISGFIEVATIGPGTLHYSLTGIGQRAIGVPRNLR